MPAHIRLRERALASFFSDLADRRSSTLGDVLESRHVSVLVERDRDGLVVSLAVVPGMRDPGVYVPIDVPPLIETHADVSGDTSLLLDFIEREVRTSANSIWDDELGVEHSALSPERLAAIGELLFGAEWKRAIAAALGPHHPSGPRSKVDDRLVRRWAAGERPIPGWVRTACLRLADERRGALQAWIDETIKSAAHSPR